MNIAFDAAAILGPMSKNRGIGNYAIDQFKTMIEVDVDNNYYFLNFFEDCRLGDILSSVNNFSEYYFYCGKDNFLLNNSEYQEIIGDIIKKFIKENSIDIFYITSPFESNNVMYQKSWFANVKVVATVYDIIPYIFKDRYLSDHNTYKWYMNCVDILKWMDKILVISNSVKDDMIKYLGFNQDIIEVIYGSISSEFKKIYISDNQKLNLFNKYEIKDKYIMCTGGDDDRKNIEGLIIAYSKIPIELISKYQLVIVCKLSSDAVEKYKQIIANNNVNDRVILTNYVSTKELVQLYNLASLMAFPSQYEGFGLPIVEAWACETPVLTSNNSSLSEIAGDAAILVNPFDYNDITRGLISALTETNLQALIEKSYKRLNIFQWNNVADLTIEAINTLNNFKETSLEIREKIAFFTPLPPLQSGISDYSVDIINEISQYFDIDIYIDSGYKPVCAFESNINIYNHKDFTKKSNQYYDVIYQMGNSEFHEYMQKYIVKYKGTLVLHDYNLHSLVQYLSLYKQSNNLKQYKEYLLEDFEKKFVNDYIEKLKCGETPILMDKLEVNGYVVNYAKKIIVHSDEAREKLLSRNIGRNVRTIRSYAKIEPLVNCSQAKEKLNISSEDIIIASFGHIHENKRIIPILKAFSKLCDEYENIKYYFVGKMDDNLKNMFYEIVKENSLDNKIKVTGYTDLNQFIDYIDIADICVNLRYPYNGETSATLMRMLAKGKCILVNDIGSFSEIPDNCCVKLPPVAKMQESEEVNEIYTNLKILIQDNKRRNCIETNAREYAINNLDIKVIAFQYKEYLCQNNQPSITEKHINRIINTEIINKQYNMKEAKCLSTTLGYSKSYII